MECTGQHFPLGINNCIDDSPDRGSSSNLSLQSHIDFIFCNPFESGGCQTPLCFTSLRTGIINHTQRMACPISPELCAVGLSQGHCPWPPLLKDEVHSGALHQCRQVAVLLLCVGHRQKCSIFWCETYATHDSCRSFCCCWWCCFCCTCFEKAQPVLIRF